MEPDGHKRRVIIGCIVVLAFALGFAIGYVAAPTNEVAPIVIEKI